MPISMDHEEYYTASEAAEYLHMSRPTFYQLIRPRLQEYRLGVLRRIYYKRTELDRYRGMHPVERGDD